jgi:cytochrome c oxidase accessory protein FixG
MNDASQHQYQARIPIYPRSVKGRFRSLKWGILLLAYGVYFALPWVRWDREHGPAQAVMFDIPGRRFYLFDLVVYPQDIFWLAGLLMIAAVLLFLVTGVAGRVFCGYFCFQTLWTDVYMFIERVIQGERPARIRLDKQPWGAGKVAKKGLTHFFWLLVAFATGLTFTLYWADATVLVGQFFRGDAPFPAYATALFLTATTYMMAGLAREQVCTYMCPYARFQAVMFDRDTLIVSYDERRGEGSAGRAKPGGELKTREARQAAGVGDCIDCGYCVQVCPTGIDIRDGLQYQCIHCALCIDACDTIMDRMGWPRGLIRYTSQKALEGGRTRLIKGKTLGYAAVLLIMSGLLVWSIASQAPLDATLAQVRQPLYVQLSDGSIQNSYEIKVNNKTQRTVELTVELDAPEGMVLDLGRVDRVGLAPEHGTTLLARVRYRVPPGERGPFDLTFRIVPQDTDVFEPLDLPGHFHTP